MQRAPVCRAKDVTEREYQLTTRGALSLKASAECSDEKFARGYFFAVKSHSVDTSADSLVPVASKD